MSSGGRKWAAWIVGAINFFCGASFVPKSGCRDGTSSAAIGRRGACSHHGGVDDNGGYWFLLLLLSAASGFVVSRIICADSSDLARPIPADPETIAAPKTSYLSSQQYDELQLRIGMSKELVALQRKNANRSSNGDD